jgi:PncC family amidohydrolase
LAAERPEELVARQLRERLGTAALAERLVALLSDRGLTVAVAEGDTGGLIGHLLTEVPGSSRCFLGGVVAYANAAKTSLLEVSDATLRDFGAVSVEAASAMALGVRRLFDSDIGLGVTGIAGPGGATAAKPAGLACIVVAGRSGRVLGCEERWQGNRGENKRRSAARALALVAEFLAADT